MENRIKKIIAVLDERKAEDIEAIDLTGKNYLVDQVVIATTLNAKHAYSLVNYLKEALKGDGEEFLRIDETDDWTIVDLGDILIHLMSEAYREKYQMEEFLAEIKKGSL
ncbi:MAG: ribosome silencing factor [Arcobacteraceae bacterium]|nr:ribosome silencing factor [Arcobacteraceae bacterium]